MMRIQINLLPYRELLRRERRQRFYVVAGLMVGLGVAIGVAGHLLMAGKIEHQESRNRFLQAEIKTLEAEIKEIANLRSQINALIARKQVIETLQGNRVQPVHMFNDLVAQIPEGAYVRTLRQSGGRVTLNGHAQSNARVSHVMRSLDASPTMANPALAEVKAVSSGGRRLSEFTLSVGLVRPPAPGDGSTSAGAK